MSVVNKMLKDLEARQSKPDEINADYQAPQKKQSKRWGLALLILSLAAITFALVDKNQLFGENKNTEVTAIVNPKPLSPASSIKKMTILTETAQIKEQIQPQIAATQPSKDTIKKVIAETDITSTIKVPAVKQILPSKLEMAADNPFFLQKIKTQNIKVQEKHLNILDSNKLKIQEAPEQTPSFTMTDSSQKNNTSSLKQRIAKSLNNDNLNLAQYLLKELLETEPDNIKARKKLAALLFAQGDYMQSKQLLIRGIELHPAKGDLRLMLARLYMVQKKPSLAINILSEFQPNREDQTEYLAYRAALAQQLKQTKLAKKDYQTLTKIESDNAKWWLGLAVAKDQLGEINMAIKSYNKASSLGQLQGSVNEFIQQRITVLAGTP
ncbi:tetratricopeptide repeat protein [Paraglaciecola psychrophila]|uniref:tetratricopeptide repeat protein n=1 Tax=Paraglaciecola psychrophila TaxID=326544 RepID=UPI0002910908|nr:tetratricopeptide repeat protein [Paraglaciecola psychrophila]GAC36467.1 MSHA biogenesis protein MshN [Paraglaciecola psychrophila 170]